MWDLRGNQRGSAALVVIGALVISASVGIGVYFIIKQQREARATSLGEEPAPGPSSPRDLTAPADPSPSPPVAEPPSETHDEGDTRGRPLAPPSDGAACDEVACVLGNYEAACCAKFRRPGPSTPSAPESPSREELSTALRMLKGKVASCAYAQELTGTFKVRFKVQPSGTVSEVTVADAEPPFTACVTRAFKNHKFSASQNGVTASFPFNVQ